jgi:carbamate kinase
MDFAVGSMGPKVLGACQFVRETGHQSAIGKLSDLAAIMTGEAGTLISNEIDGICYEPAHTVAKVAGSSCAR